MMLFLLLVQDDISADRLREHATYLAGDELEGRLAGFPGNDKAADYLVMRIREIGLAPLGDKDDRGERSFFEYRT